MGATRVLDLKHAMNMYDKACDGGSARGCVNVGDFYENAKSKYYRKNLYTALKYYEKACDLEPMVV